MPRELWEPLPPEVKKMFCATLDRANKNHESWVRYYEQTHDLKAAIRKLEGKVKVGCPRLLSHFR